MLYPCSREGRERPNEAPRGRRARDTALELPLFCFLSLALRALALLRQLLGTTRAAGPRGRCLFSLVVVIVVRLCALLAVRGAGRSAQRLGSGWRRGGAETAIAVLRTLHCLDQP